MIFKNYAYEKLSEDELLLIFEKGFEILDNDSPFKTDDSLVLIFKSGVTSLVSLKQNNGEKKDGGGYSFPRPFNEFACLMVADNYFQFDSGFHKFNQFAAINALIELKILE